MDTSYYNQAQEQYDNAKKAADNYAHDEVLQYCEVGLLTLDKITPPTQDSKSLRIDLLLQQGDTLEILGRYSQALEAYFKAVELLQANEDNDNLARVYNSIAWIYRLQREYDSAQNYYQQSLDIAIKADNQTRIARVYVGIGGLHKNKGDYDKALEYLQRALAIQEKLGEKPKIASTYNWIGTVYQGKKLYDQALEWYHKAVALNQKLDEQEGLAWNYNNIGFIYNAQQKYENVVKQYRKALDIWQEINNKRGEISTTENIALFYNNQKEYDKALIWYQKLVSLLNSVEDRKKLASVYEDIGVIYRDQGENILALEWYKKALTVRELMDNQKQITRLQNWVGVLYMRLGEFDEALNWYQKAITTNEQLDYKEELSWNYNNTAILYRKRNDYEQALIWYQKAIEVRTALNDMAQVADCYENMGRIYRDSKDYGKAILCYQKSVDIRESLDDMYGVASCYESMGKIHQNGNKHDQAILHYQKSATIQEDLGNKKSLPSIYQNIGYSHKKKRQYEETLTFYHKALVLDEELDRKSSMTWDYGAIGETYRIIKKYDEAIQYAEKQIELSLTIENYSEVVSGYVGIVAALLEQKINDKALKLIKEGLLYAKDKNINDANTKWLRDQLNKLNPEISTSVSIKKDWWQNLPQQEDTPFRLTDGIVRILSWQGHTVGTGFVVSEKIIITCAHVIADAGSSPGDTVKIVFYCTNTEADVTVETDGWREPTAEDVAILTLSDPLPERVKPLPLATTKTVEGHGFHTYGYPAGEGLEGGLEDRGKIGNKTTVAGQNVFQLSEAKVVTGGFSGAPLWDEQLERVVGMIVSNTYPDERGRMTETAFATPTETLLTVWPDLTLAPISANRFRVPPFPDNFVDRLAEFDQLLTYLLNDTTNRTIGLTTALKGGGGFGKTTLANAVCYYPDVQQKFIDGIFWVELGENPNRLEIAIELIKRLSGQAETFPNLKAAIVRLQELLKHQHILLVLDDVWRESDASSFIIKNPTGAYIVTTRRQDVANRQAHQITVNEMTSDEATTLLVNSLTAPPETIQPLRQLAQDLGEWPQLLSMAGAYLNELIRDEDLSLNEAITDLRRRLKRKGFTYLDRNDEDKREWAIGLTLEVSLKRLEKTWRNCYLELAVFPENIDIPFSAIEKLWHQTANLDEIDSVDALRRMRRYSLFSRYDKENQHIRLHDVIHKILRQWQQDKLSQLHLALLKAYRPANQTETPAWLTLPPDEIYMWHYLGYHLFYAGQDNALYQLLTNFRFIQTKITLFNSHALLSDYELLLDNNQTLVPIYKWLRQHSYLFDQCQDKSELAVTMFSRILNIPELREFIPDLEATLKTPYLTCNWLPKLNPRLMQTIAWRHTGYTQDFAINPVCQTAVAIVSDNMLKTWDLKTGEEKLALVGRESGYSRVSLFGKSAYSCAISDNQIIVAAFYNEFLKVWDGQTGTELFTLKVTEPPDKISSCTINANGKIIVTTSQKGVLKIWDGETGKERLMINTNHEHTIEGCVINKNGTIVITVDFGSMLKVWNVKTGEKLHHIIGSPPTPKKNGKGFLYTLSGGFSLSTDGQVIAATFSDNTLKIWYLNQNREPLIIKEKPHAFSYIKQPTCAISSDNRIVASANKDNFIRIWDIQTGNELLTLEGHAKDIKCCTFSQDNKNIISIGEDETIRVWDIVTEYSEEDKYLNNMSACSLAKDGQFAVFTGTIRSINAGIWNIDKMIGEGGLNVLMRKAGLITMLEHAEAVNMCSLNRHGQVIAVTTRPAIRKNTVKIWDAGLERFAKVFDFPQESKKRGPTMCRISGNGQILVVVMNGSLEIWDAYTGQELLTITDTPHSIQRCAVSDDAKITVTVDNNGIMKVWDTFTGQEKTTIVGYTGSIPCYAINSNGKLTISAHDDYSLKLWNNITGEPISTLIGHTTAVKACDISDNGQLAVSIADKTIKVWDTFNAQCLTSLIVDSSLNDCSYSGDGQKIVAVGKAGPYVFQLVGAEMFVDKPRLQLIKSVQGHSDYATQVIMLPNKQEVVSKRWSDLKVWDLTGQELFALEAPSSIALTREGRYAVLYFPDEQRTEIWDLVLKTKVQTLTGTNDSVSLARLMPNKKHILISSAKTHRIWDIESGELITTIEEESSPIENTAITPDGKYLIVTFGMNSVRVNVWNLHDQTVREFLSRKSHSKIASMVPVMVNTSRTIDMTPDGKKVIVAGNASTVRANLSGKPEPDWIAQEYQKGIEIRVWDVETGETQHVLRGHGRQVISAKLARDSSMLISAGADGAIAGWNLITGNCFAIGDDDTDSYVMATEFTSDGKYLISVAGKVLKLWRLDTFKLIDSVEVENHLFDCTIAPDGETIVVCDMKGYVHFFRLVV